MLGGKCLMQILDTYYFNFEVESSPRLGARGTYAITTIYLTGLFSQACQIQSPPPPNPMHSIMLFCDIFSRNHVIALISSLFSLRKGMEMPLPQLMNSFN